MTNTMNNTKRDHLIHEAGHAVIATMFGFGLDCVYQDRCTFSSSLNEETKTWDEIWEEEWNEKWIMVYMAGVAANIIDGTSIMQAYSRYGRRDAQQATRICIKHGKPELLVDRIELKVRKILKQPHVWQAAEEVAEWLCTHKTCPNYVVKEICDKADKLSPAEIL